MNSIITLFQFILYCDYVNRGSIIIIDTLEFK
jgi:hypothetical protein